MMMKNLRRASGEVMPAENCSADETSGSEPRREKGESRRKEKERIGWKKQKLEAEIRDLFSSDSEDMNLGKRRESRQKTS
jgi:hypothetical protein